MTRDVRDTFSTKGWVHSEQGHEGQSRVGRRSVWGRVVEGDERR